MDTDQGPVAYTVDRAVVTITMRTPSPGLAAKQLLLAAVTETAGDDGQAAAGVPRP